MAVATKEKQMALSEVYDILKHTERELLERISKKFIKYVYDNMDKGYLPNIDYSKDIYSQNLRYETIVILSIIYRDYLCSQEEKEKLLRKDKEELDKIKQNKLQSNNIQSSYIQNNNIQNNNIQNSNMQNDSIQNDNIQGNNTQSSDIQNDNIQSDNMSKLPKDMSLEPLKQEKWYVRIFNKIKSWFK